jgi:hypothetical protein
MPEKTNNPLNLTTIESVKPLGTGLDHLCMLLRSDKIDARKHERRQLNSDPPSVAKLENAMDCANG